MIRRLARLFAPLCLLLLAGSALAAPAGLFLWEAERGSQKVALLGSIHLGRAEFYPLPAPIEAAYRRAGTIAVEADIGDPAALVPLLPMLMLPAGETLETKLAAPQRRRLDAALARTGLAAPAALRMKPWFLAMTLSAMEMQKLGFDPQYGIDLHYLGRARKDGKQVVELESVRGQFELLDGLGADEQLAFLDTTADSIANGQMKSELDAMVAAWRSGDAVTLRRQVDDGLGDGPAMRRVAVALFDARNRAMAERIAALAGPVPPLVIVGAGHLAGPGSIVELLKSRGFRVTQKR